MPKFTGNYRVSVADPGWFIPDPTIAPSRIRIPDPGGKKHQSRIRNTVFYFFIY
jgi:hypothetical protein